MPVRRLFPDAPLQPDAGFYLPPDGLLGVAADGAKTRDQDVPYHSAVSRGLFTQAFATFPAIPGALEAWSGTVLGQVLCAYGHACGDLQTDS